MSAEADKRFCLRCGFREYDWYNGLWYCTETQRLCEERKREKK